MEFSKLGIKERALLLPVLGFSIRHTLRCQECDDVIDFRTCSIMPPLHTKLKATLLCEGVLCLSAYLTNHEQRQVKK